MNRVVHACFSCGYSRGCSRDLRSEDDRDDEGGVHDHDACEHDDEYARDLAGCSHDRVVGFFLQCE